MNTARRTILGASLALALIAGLGGCSAPNSDGALDPIFGGAATVAPTEAPAVAAPLVGDINADGKLDGWERERLASLTYTLADGSKAALPALGAPLPAAVVKSVQAKVLAGGAVGGRTSEAQNAIDNAAYAALEAESELLGRVIVPVFHGYNVETGGMTWCAGGVAAGQGCSADKAAAIAIADAWVNGQSQYVVIPFG